MHSLTLNIWLKAITLLFSLFKYEILSRSIFNSGWHAIVFTIQHFTSPRLTIFPWQEWPSVPLLPSQQCEHNGMQSLPQEYCANPSCSHSHQQLYPVLGCKTLCWSFHSRSPMGGWGMQCWQRCSCKRLLIVSLFVSGTAHTRITLPLQAFKEVVWWWRAFPFPLILSSLMVWPFLQGKQVSTC